MDVRGWLRLVVLALAPVALSNSAGGAEPVIGKGSQGCVTVSIAYPKAGKRCIAPGSGAVVWFKDCATCPQMVAVPDIRRPGKLFAAGRFAVTFAEWDACVAGGGCNGHRPADEGWGRDNRPVVNVNWGDAVAYTQWLSKVTGKAYRLPSAVERDHLARAGSTSSYWWGEDIDLDRANYDVPVPSRRMPGVDYSEVEKLRRKTVPVDSFLANRWGLYNVHGNVWEWTRDCAQTSGPVAVGPRVATKATDCGERISLGGSWNDFAEQARANRPVGFNAMSRNRAQGFRVIRVLP